MGTLITDIFCRHMKRTNNTVQATILGQHGLILHHLTTCQMNSLEKFCNEHPRIWTTVKSSGALGMMTIAASHIRHMIMIVEIPMPKLIQRNENAISVTAPRLDV
jgi:uncharacterized Zn-finger protein